MNHFRWAALCLILPAMAGAQSSSVAAPGDAGLADVRRAIEAFYNSFNEGFTGPADFAAEDWNHISPGGARTQGRDATLKSVRQVHQSFLKGVTQHIESMDVRLAAGNVAVGTVVSLVSPYTSPNGVKHDTQREIRTFVLVKRGERWLIVQDQTTTIARVTRP